MPKKQHPETIKLEFHVAVASAKGPETPTWSEHSVELPRLAAVELAKFLYEFVPEDGEPPLMFAVADSFLEKLTEGERIRIEAGPDDPRVAERLRRDPPT